VATRNTDTLKKMIYAKLTSDTTGASSLKALLGGDITRVRHGNPQQLSDYPLLCYVIVSDEDNPYRVDQSSDYIVKTHLVIYSFSTSTSSTQAENIEDRVYYLLHGKKLTTTAVRAYTCYRRSKSLIYESEVKVWRCEAHYELVNYIK